MTSDDIIATYDVDAPEVLDAEALDSITGATAYGGTNTCEPVKRPSGHGKWIDILSVSTPSFEQVTGSKEIRQK